MAVMKVGAIQNMIPMLLHPVIMLIVLCPIVFVLSMVHSSLAVWMSKKSPSLFTSLLMTPSMMIIGSYIRKEFFPHQRKIPMGVQFMELFTHPTNIQIMPWSISCGIKGTKLQFIQSLRGNLSLGGMVMLLLKIGLTRWWDR